MDENNRSAPVGRADALGDTAAKARYAGFYQQKVQWRPCGSGLTCTTVKVPLDWTVPEKGTVSLAVNRRKASTSNRLGSLLYNPGGPGGSGFDFVKQINPASDAVAKRYDVIGFDPRGVGRSVPVDCLSDPDLDAYLSSDLDPSTPEGLAQTKAADRRFGEGCKAKSGAVLGYVGTWSAARDLDVIRSVVGDPKLNLLGQSYGTLLGATYAGFYPQRAGRMVLDGALDPSSSNADVSLYQAEGFETDLRDYMKACLAGTTGTCPFKGSVDDGMAEVRRLLDRLHTNPVEVSGRRLVPTLAVSGITMPLYGGSTEWVKLTPAFARLEQGDGAAMMAIADQYNSRRDDGSYDHNGNSTEAFYAVNCLDYPPQETTAAELRAQAKQLEKAAPTLGKWFAYSDVFCESYPEKAVRTPARITAAGSGPILVVGTTHDPATPYRWAQRLTSQLSNATLLTYVGDGHTAYMRDSTCVDTAVDRYLIDGTLPAKGTKCTS